MRTKRANLLGAAATFAAAVTFQPGGASANTTMHGSICYGVDGSGRIVPGGTPMSGGSPSLVVNNWGIHSTLTSTQSVWCPLNYQFVDAQGMQTVQATVWRETAAGEISCTLYATDRSGFVLFSGVRNTVGAPHNSAVDLTWGVSVGAGFGAITCSLPGASGGVFNYVSSLLD